jgi:hypothetical protein
MQDWSLARSWPHSPPRAWAGCSAVLARSHLQFRCRPARIYTARYLSHTPLTSPLPFPCAAPVITSNSNLEAAIALERTNTNTTRHHFAAPFTSFPRVIRRSPFSNFPLLLAIRERVSTLSQHSQTIRRSSFRPGASEKKEVATFLHLLFPVTAIFHHFPLHRRHISPLI